jgi:short-subunit dehydrogenase
MFNSQKENFWISKKVIWIIGGTSGIGLAIAKNLVTKGCQVIISGRDIEKTKNWQDKNLYQIALDVNFHNQWQEAIDKISQIGLRVTNIIFAAGYYQPMNLANFDCNIATNILQTNLGSMVNLVDLICQNPNNLFCEGGELVIISSVASYCGMKNSLFYGASKAGLSHLADSLAIELSAKNIRVRLVNPGFVATPMTAKNQFKMPFIISAEEAANIIVAKLEKSAFEIAFPTLFTKMIRLFSYLPQKIRVMLFSKY